jgi:Family of unknown function (DUF6882)
MATIQALFDEHAALAFHRQTQLMDRIGDWAWDFDMDAGTMTFSSRGFLGFGKKRIETQCQVLGSESEASGTWLWGWGNEESGIPADLLRVADSLRELGEVEGIAEFTNPSLPLDAWDGHRIAMLASGKAEDCAGYFCGPYEGGALFVLLTGPDLAMPIEDPASRFVTLFPEAIMTFEIHDHALAARGLARDLGLEVSGSDEMTISDGRSTMRLTFDTEGRLASLEGERPA